jgi:LPXTG-motif cell wall-anchored protein
VPETTELSLARTVGRLAGIGAVGAVGAMLAAPMAHAQPLATPSANSAPQVGEASAGPALTLTTQPAPTQTITPNYGFQKIRVGIAVKSGAVVPSGTVLSGAQLQIVTSTVTDPVSATGSTTTCTTGADGFCTGTTMLAPGQTATVTQLSAPDGLVGPTAAVTQQPCTTDCQTSPPADLVLQDTGPLPTAGNDTATVATGGTVSIKVLANDSGDGAPITSITATTPAHGTVTTSTTAISYRATAGFSGVDTFSYTVTTANGSATANVRVTVAAAPASSSAAPTSVSASVSPTASATPTSVSATPTPSATSSAVLAATGAAGTSTLTWTGAGLVAAGSLALFGARRRVAVEGRRH